MINHKTPSRYQVCINLVLIMTLSYKLRATLDAHSADVRAISCDGEDIITASRDKTAILWRPSDDNS